MAGKGRAKVAGKPYPAAWGDPVANGQERESQCHDQHHQTLDGHRLFPQTGEVLIPDGQELLLAVGVGHKLWRQQRGKRGREGGGGLLPLLLT